MNLSPSPGSGAQPPYEVGITEVHFFGDKTMPGGGDYELYSHPRTIGHAVDSPEHTIQEVKRILL